MSSYSISLAAALVSLAGAAPAMKAEPFDLADVRLLDGPFKHAQELDRQYLLSLEPERMLHNFRVTAGLPAPAPPYGGWEAPNCEVRGHFVGHYLTACALMYRSTGDEQLKENAARAVAGMAECQAKLGNGYVSGFPEEHIDRVVAGKPVWAPWYNIHKIYAGLLDQYLLCGNTQALEVLRKACDWAKARMDRLDDVQMQRMLENEHGGINEVLADVSAATGDPKYLELARRFNHHAVLDPLARREDRLTGLHANTQFPKVIGIARQYELAGGDDLRAAAEFFWETVTRERSYVTGSNSYNEHFSPKEKLSQYLGEVTGETCNTYNMLRLTRHLFQWEPKAEYADYYERALYNHILASQEPETGMLAYMLPLGAGAARGDDPAHPGFSKPFDSFWCCTGTGIESQAKYADSIYFHGGDSDLYLNLFIASELKWKARGITLRQETRFPDEPASRLTFTCERPAEVALHVRHPYWARAIEIRVNGKAQTAAGAPGSYAVIRREWKSGDTVEVRLPMHLRTEAFHDNPRRFALMYGPLVLCAETERGSKTAFALAKPDAIPSQVRPVAGRPLAFSAPGALFRRSFDTAEDVLFTPFLREFRKPYVVYWDAVTAGEWQAKEKEHREKAAGADARQRGDHGSLPGASG